MDVAGRVARPFGSALTDPGLRRSRTRLFPELTRIVGLEAPMGEISSARVLEQLRTPRLRQGTARAA
jgi:hypothetical protein